MITLLTLYQCDKFIIHRAKNTLLYTNTVVYKQNFLVDQTRACVNCQPARVLMSGFSISCTCARGISIRMIVLGFKLLNATSQLCSVKNYIIIILCTMCTIKIYPTLST